MLASYSMQKRFFRIKNPKMNYNLNSLLLLLSISLNIVFLFITIFIIFQKGGIYYLKSQIIIMANKKNQDNNLNINSYYKHKKSQFEVLKKSNNAIVFVGDSLTDEGEWVELLGNNHILNRGISGDTTLRILNRIDTIIQTKPKQIFLMVGINDFVNRKNSIEEVLSNYKIILEAFQKEIPQTKVFIQSVLPVNNHLAAFFQNNGNIIKFNLKLQELTELFNYQYIDVFSHLADSENQLDAMYTTDGLHLNGKAYLIWKEVLTNHIAVN